ncbi:hypothetical protein [Streptococcus oricebi]|uniref:Lipoprotein n=1 Tax=Streptococcus oricebi TaxID=1547447 RepID=A0ABS5B2E1_9STRE|nr:hypothetical protein [Streptococcus oricebi]MBP2622994.1 hypothetical protein [Streptococcus oricebi]
MKKIFKIFLVLLGLFLLFCVFMMFYSWYRTNQPIYDVRSPKVEKIDLIANDKYVAVTDKNEKNGSYIFVGQDILVTNPRKERYNGKDTSTRYTEAYSYINVYNLKQPSSKPKKINLYALLEKVGISNRLYGSFVDYYGTVDGKEYLLIRSVRRHNFYHVTYHRLDWQTEKLEKVDVSSSPIQRWYKEGVLNDAIRNSNLASLTADNAGLEINWVSGRHYFDKYDKKAFQLEQTNFGSLYPDVTKRLKEGKTYVFPRWGYVSDEEYFNDMNHWFAPQGQEKLPLSAAVYVADRQTEERTPIGSYADFIEWRKAHPKEKEKN